MENPYGNIIRQEREAADMTREELASLLIMPPEHLALVEQGKDTLSDFRLNMVANTFRISKSELSKGVRAPWMSVSEMTLVLENISKEISELEQIQTLLEEQIYDKSENMKEKGLDEEQKEDIQEEREIKM